MLQFSSKPRDEKSRIDTVDLEDAVAKLQSKCVEVFLDPPQGGTKTLLMASGLPAVQDVPLKSLILG